MPASSEGDVVGTSYDPLLAKLIAHAPTRAQALDRLGGALAETEVAGVTTNLAFLRWLVDQPDGAGRTRDDRVPDRAPTAVASTGAPAEASLAQARGA